MDNVRFSELAVGADSVPPPPLPESTGLPTAFTVDEDAPCAAKTPNTTEPTAALGASSAEISFCKEAISVVTSVTNSKRLRDDHEKSF